MNRITEEVFSDAAAIASSGNGLPREEFVTLAVEVLHRLAGYGSRWQAVARQDADYLARILQSCADRTPARSV